MTKGCKGGREMPMRFKGGGEMKRRREGGGGIKVRYNKRRRDKRGCKEGRKN